ncbi:unnamed protein product [Didymodactylos carnosus]|uniref:Uncharacterized protein n=1 Tax=Didymodactylos carnosus TaxID=1234261 RepID=A0A8S2HH22_9BILA|nr:unnamed protein product [Didymodactylos carnosus]CAF3644324.1 unnamed protein product [Didymodactylos carnosus]
MMLMLIVVFVRLALSSDESSACYEQLFNQRRFISAPECNRPYLVNYLMADVELEHRKLVPKDKWNDIDTDIHALQLSFSDDIFNRGSLLLTQKWSADRGIQQFQQYCFDQWITKPPLWYLTNFAVIGMKVQHSIYLQRTMAESLNGKIKQQYTLRNKLHLSSFLPKQQRILNEKFIKLRANSILINVGMDNDSLGPVDKTRSNERILIFATDEQLQLLFNSTQFPCVFALLPRRKRNTYVKLFRYIKDNAIRLNTVFNPTRIMSDFESGLKAAIVAEVQLTPNVLYALKYGDELIFGDIACTFEKRSTSAERRNGFEDVKHKSLVNIHSSNNITDKDSAGCIRMIRLVTQVRTPSKLASSSSPMIDDESSSSSSSHNSKQNGIGSEQQSSDQLTTSPIKSSSSLLNNNDNFGEYYDDEILISCNAVSATLPLINKQV